MEYEFNKRKMRNRVSNKCDNYHNFFKIFISYLNVYAKSLHRIKTKLRPAATPHRLQRHDNQEIRLLLESALVQGSGSVAATLLNDKMSTIVFTYIRRLCAGSDGVESHEGK